MLADAHGAPTSRRPGGQNDEHQVTAPDPPSATPAHTLSVVDLRKSFGPVEVLRGITLTARKGDVISLLGASGSGKSTFLRCINMLEAPTGGTVTVAGEAIAMTRRRDGTPAPADPRQVERLRRKIGMVFQSFNLWSHMTVLGNVVEAPIHVLGLGRDEAVARAERILCKVGMDDRKDYYPAHLSGGQQQRAAIARALAMEPDLMLFDEPTSALDPELVGEVLEVIAALAAEGRTMLVVTHEMDFARRVSSHLVFLHQGLIEEQGPPDRLFDAPASERFVKFLARVRH